MNCNAQQFEWVHTGGIQGSNGGYKVYSDGHGGAYFLNFFFKKIYFQGTNMYSNVGFQNGFFIIANNANGSTRWVFKSDDNSSISGFGTAFSLNNGFSISGSLYSNNETIGGVKLPGINYLAHIDTSGHLLWAKNKDVVLYPGGGKKFLRYMSISSGHNILSLNSFNCDSLQADGLNIKAGAGNNYTFLASSDTSGKVKWIKNLGIVGDAYGLGEITTDLNDNIYLTRGFYDYAYINSNLYTANPGYGTAFAKFRPNGQFCWSKQFAYHGGGDCNIKTDKTGNVYMAGYAGLNANFDGTIINSSAWNAFIVKLDSNGKVLWLRNFNSEHGENYCDNFCLDDYGNIFIAGSFRNNIIVGKDTFYAGDTITSNAMFVSCFDSSGNMLWFKPFGYSADGNALYQSGIADIATDSRGSVFITGKYNGNAKFDTFNLKLNGSSNIFNAKITVPFQYPDSVKTSIKCKKSPLSLLAYYRTMPDSVVWDFGDGDTSHRIQPSSHNYNNPGDYKISLTAYFRFQNPWKWQKTIHFAALPAKILPKDTTLCKGQVMAINARCAGANAYLWNDADTSSKRIFTIQGNYKLKITSGTCTLLDSINIQYNNTDFSFGRDTTLCPAKTLTLYAPDWADKRLWSDGTNSPSITINKQGDYWLYASKGYCSHSDTIHINYTSKLPTNVFNTPDTFLCDRQSIEVNIKNYQAKALWQDGSKVQLYSITKAGAYAVKLSTVCETKDYYLNVRDSNCTCYIYTPNTFSPDNNGLNDFFKPVPTCPAEQYLLRVYNRWGQMLYQSTDPNSAGWDGSYNHSPCPEGVYMYTLYYKARDNKYYRHGSVQLLRD